MAKIIQQDNNIQMGTHGNIFYIQYNKYICFTADNKQFTRRVYKDYKTGQSFFNYNYNRYYLANNH